MCIFIFKWEWLGTAIENIRPYSQMAANLKFLCVQLNSLTRLVSELNFFWIVNSKTTLVRLILILTK